MIDAESVYIEDPRIGKVIWTPTEMAALGVFGHILEGEGNESERFWLMKEIAEDFAYIISSFMDSVTTFAHMYVALTHERFTEEERMQILATARGYIDGGLDAISTSLETVESTYFTDLEGEEQ